MPDGYMLTHKSGNNVSECFAISQEVYKMLQSSSLAKEWTMSHGKFGKNMKFAEKEQGGMLHPFSSKEYAIQTFVKLGFMPFWLPKSKEKDQTSKDDRKSDSKAKESSSQKKEPEKAKESSAKSQTTQDSKSNVGNIVLASLSIRGTKGSRECYLICPTVSTGDSSSYLEPGSNPELIRMIEDANVEGSFGGIVDNSVAQSLRNGHYLQSTYNSQLTYAMGIIKILSRVLVSNLKIGKASQEKFLKGIDDELTLGGLQVKNSELEEEDVKRAGEAVVQLKNLLSSNVEDIKPFEKVARGKEKKSMSDRWSDVVSFVPESDGGRTEEEQRFLLPGKTSSEFLSDQQIKTLSEYTTAISDSQLGKIVDVLLETVFPGVLNSSSQKMNVENKITSRQLDIISMRLSILTTAEVMSNSFSKAKLAREKEELSNNSTPKPMLVLPDYMSSGASFSTNIRTFESVPWLNNNSHYENAKGVVDTQLPYAKVLETWFWNQIQESFSNSLVASLSYYRMMVIPPVKGCTRFRSIDDFKSALMTLDPERKAVQYSTPGAAFTPYTAKDVVNMVKTTISDRNQQTMHIRTLLGLVPVMETHSPATGGKGEPGGSASSARTAPEIAEVNEERQLLEKLLSENSEDGEEAKARREATIARILSRIQI
jgi:hypothetical protein